MRRIGALPEGPEAHAAQGVDEAFALGAQGAIHLDHSLDGRRDFVLRHRRTDDFTERGEAVRRAAEGDLVPLLAVLVDAEDADVADVVMAAGVHAAGHLDLDVAQVVQVVEIRSEEHTSELQSQSNIVCRLLLEKKKKQRQPTGCPTSRQNPSARQRPLQESALTRTRVNTRLPSPRVT